MPPQPREQLVGDTVGALPGDDRIFDDELVGIVQLRVIRVIEQPVGAGRRHTLDRRENLPT